jgi:hypothetical protein
MINEKIYSDITTYEIKNKDRILISYGDPEDVTKQLRYLDSLKIHDPPRQNYLVPGKDFSV